MSNFMIHQGGLYPQHFARHIFPDTPAITPAIACASTSVIFMRLMSMICGDGQPALLFTAACDASGKSANDWIKSQALLIRGLALLSVVIT